MTDEERAARQYVLDALLELDPRTFQILIAVANGLLQYFALQSDDPDAETKALDAVLFYTRTRG